ncbi:MAG TPA: ATP-binding cassette domain-containing protein [Rhizomicrobium sp.]|jgi:ABC-2 type transport system ATP-binding protein
MVPSPPALEVVSLAKRFSGRDGISDVSMSVEAGSITGFIGANGSGKSTTLRCILGMLRADAGEVSLFGARAGLQQRRRVGFMPEERGLFAHERAREAIAFHGRLKGMKRRDAFQAADRLLARVGLGGREKARIGSLSKGNAQRVQMLCALVHGPSLLLLDEPLSGLDPVAQAEMLSLFAEFRAAGGAILFSTHVMAAAETLCDRVVMLACGRTVFEGTLSGASALAPHGAVVVTADPVGLAAAAAVLGGAVQPIGSRLGEACRWRVVLPKGVAHPALLQALAARGVSIFSFEQIKPDLEAAFWQLADAGASGGAGKLRAA